MSCIRSYNDEAGSKEEYFDFEQEYRKIGLVRWIQRFRWTVGDPTQSL